MQFLLLLYRDRVPTPPLPETIESDVDAWVSEHEKRGIWRTGDPLAADAEAVTVRVRDGRPQVDDGAFCDTSPGLVGFDVLDCRDRDEAVAVAVAHPLAARLVLELRPVLGR